MKHVPDVTSDTFHLISLGCAKNTVDSSSMSQLLAAAGYRASGDRRRAAILIVNTCGFIEPAREESFRELRQVAAQKRKWQILIAAGCLTQRYGMEIARQVPGVDGILGTRRWMDIVEVVEALRDAGADKPAPGARGRRARPPRPLCHLPEAPTVGTDERGAQQVAIQGASAYLKIADGCRRPCAFCAIPLIKGAAVSRAPETILAEACSLRDRGVREIVLIAQDTTDYGYDRGMKDGLARLLERLVAEVPDIAWVRILYAYPGVVTDRLIDVMASRTQIVPYLDLPLQHAHPATLRRMGRPTNTDAICRTLEKMRARMPDLALRTTFLVGYPGETEEEFATLLAFVRDIRFDRVGAFPFSFELGTPSEPLGDPIPPAVKRERYERLMQLQQGISLELNQAQVGKTLDVLIEGRGEGISLGRSYRDAPEIDGLVLVEGEVPAGEMVPVRITGAMPYDLRGRASSTAE